MARIAIDMTPMFPGGENGGVKLLALELIKGFQEISPQNSFLLLTASWNDKDLSFLDSANTQRLCILKKHKPLITDASTGLGSIEKRLRNIWRLLINRSHFNLGRNGILSQKGVDVLFCPFTAPTYAESGIPVVSLVCDLQHKDYPQFFNANDIYARDAFIGEVIKKADAIICISETTRRSVIHHLKADPDKTHMVHNCIHVRLKNIDPLLISEHLNYFNIGNRPYMFYPANFWPHKNHRMLITAYGMYVARNPESNIDLVFTGALEEAQQKLRDNVRRMGLEERIHFLGYLPDDQLTSVWQGCSFLVFPSLYEGFGIPVLEAMQFGKPVLCSNVTSLPEVAGTAALYFDPRKPEEIVQCMEKLIGIQDLCAVLVKRGYERLSYFQPGAMVRNYLQCIEDVLA